MSQFDSINENKEKPKLSILAVESDPEVVALYRSWFMKRMGLPVNVVPAEEIISKKKENVNIIIAEPPKDESIGDFVLELRKLYPDQQIVIASQRKDIISEIKDFKKFPNVTALTKPFHMEELGELVDVLQSKDWRKEVHSETSKNPRRRGNN